MIGDIVLNDTGTIIIVIVLVVLACFGLLYLLRR